MKNTKIIISALLGFFINVASAENFSAGINYASDYLYRGSLTAGQSVQSEIGFNTSKAGLGFSAGAFTNQAIGSSPDSYIFGAGISKSFAEDLLSAYAGFNHVEDVAGSAFSEVELSLGVKWHLSPTVNFYRNLEDSLYTYELNLGHAFDFDLFSLGLNGSVGNTDTTASTDNTYYILGASASRSLSEDADLSVAISRADSDTISDEYIFEIGVALKF